MRIQFFRDGLSGILEKSSTEIRSPVMEVLAEARSTFPEMDMESLHDLVDAREKDLSYPSFSTLGDLASFASRTQGPLIRAHATALLSTCSPDVQKSARGWVTDAADFAGEAVGLSVLLRGAPAHAASRLSYMPLDVARERGVSEAALLAGGDDAAPAFADVASRAERALELAEEAMRSVPRTVRPAFWGLSLPRIYLKRMRRAGNDPFNEALQQGMRQTYPLRLQISLLQRKLLGR